MADLNARIKPKKSSTASEVPQAADLEVAELAVNTADGKLFTKHTDGSIVEISGGGGGGAVDSVNGNTGVVVVDLDSATTQGATTNNDISVGDLLTVQGDGAAQDGRLKLNCSANTHGVTIQSPPHSDAATYTLTLPSSAGTTGQVLTSQGGSQLTWEDASTGAVDSVNGQTGVVQLDLENLENVVNNIDATAPYSNGVTFAPASDLDTPGEWGYWGTDCKFYKLDDNGVDRTAQLSALKTGDTFYFNFNNGALTGTATLTADAIDELGDGSVWSFQTNTSVGTFGGPLVLTLQPQGPTDGQVLTWVNANNQWEPGSLGIQDLNDYGPSVSVGTIRSYNYQSSGFIPSSGNYTQGNSQLWTRFNNTDANGDPVFTVPYDVPGSIWYSSDSGATWNEITYAWAQDETANSSLYLHSPGTTFTDGTVLITDSYSLASSPTDGQVLTWVGANSQWEAVTPSGGGSTTLASLTDVATTDSTGASVYRFDPLPSIGAGVTRVILNPHGTSAYTYAGYGVWSNGHASIVGGTDGTSRACINLNSSKKVFFGPTPISGSSSTDHTLEILASGSAGAQMRYRVHPTLGTGTTDTVVPTMGLVREEFDAAGMRAILGIGEYADDTAAGTGGVASGAMYFNTTSSDYRVKS